MAQCDGEQEIFIIGGGEIYTQTIDRADRIYLTTIHEHVDGNVYFPEFDEADFVQIEREDYNAPVQHSFMVLERSGD